MEARVGKGGARTLRPPSCHLSLFQPLSPSLSSCLSLRPPRAPLPSVPPHPSPTMPTCRRKRVVLTEPSEALLHALKSDPTRAVFYLEQTGEIFETFEYVLSCAFFRVPRHKQRPIRAYAARMSFYRLKQFQCEVTGKSGLDYFQAVESERQEAKTMHARFPEPLKPAVLKAVQWRKCFLRWYLLGYTTSKQRLWAGWTTS